RGRIIVDKLTNPAGDSSIFTFHTTAIVYKVCTLTESASPHYQELAPGSYSESELEPAGCNLSNLVIVDPTNNSSSAGSTATLNLAAGETIT
ncbi:hypothetical protein, partial [Pseudomonas sp. AH2 (2023)]|uniref:hypothetical protein n=1 Tax=Pseudomonas sp. AH2 (2023) TaxID=3048599 RepID=UPI002B2296B2